ncbi:hypothetical protein OS493_001225 [Desmophyllum pertusum]|uniref:Uncharacterized protein n=1 Tax=Desmophyllum pertusum TaxID=174260 RepID=A0A9W9ZU52_9CNID|nr:hypothetical protein OS493_001225 [Desmophyllum pertusum]
MTTNEQRAAEASKKEKERKEQERLQKEKEEQEQERKYGTVDHNGLNGPESTGIEMEMLTSLDSIPSNIKGNKNKANTAVVSNSMPLVDYPDSTIRFETGV